MQTCLHIHPRGILIHRVYLALACQILCIARFVWHTSHEIWWWWFALTHSDTDTDMHTSVQRHAEHIDTRYYYMSYGLKWFEVVSRRKDEWVSERARQSWAERTFCTALYRITCALCVYNGTSEMHIILFSQRFSIVSSMYCLSIITNK